MPPVTAPPDDPRTRLRRRVGLNIRNRRREQGLSQEQFAKLLKLPRPQLSNWETGIYHPNPAALADIAEKLDCDMGWFYVDHTLDDPDVA